MKRKFIAFVNRRYVHSVGMPVCGSEELAPVDFDVCEPETSASEIQRLFLRKINSADLDDWTQAAEWNARVSETSTDIDAIRALTVIGDKPAPAATRKDISGGRKITTRKDHTINFEIDESTAVNHDFVRSIQEGKRYKGNYETAGAHMYGGNGGIVGEITLDMVLNRGQGEITKYIGTFTWSSTQTEERCLSPIFGETVLGSDSLDTVIDFTADATPAHGDSDFVLAGGTSAVAKFRYNEITPTIGAAITMTVKVSTVLKLTMNTTADFVGQPFIFTDTAGVDHSGFIASGDVLF